MSYYQCCYMTSDFSSYYSTDSEVKPFLYALSTANFLKSRSEPIISLTDWARAPYLSFWSASFEVLRRAQNKGGINNNCVEKADRKERNEWETQRKVLRCWDWSGRNETPYLPPPPHPPAGRRRGVFFKRRRKVISPPPPNTHVHTQFPLSLLSFHLFLIPLLSKF